MCEHGRAGGDDKLRSNYAHCTNVPPSEGWDQILWLAGETSETSSMNFFVVAKSGDESQGEATFKNK